MKVKRQSQRELRIEWEHAMNAKAFADVQMNKTADESGVDSKAHKDARAYLAKAEAELTRLGKLLK